MGSEGKSDHLKAECVSPVKWMMSACVGQECAAERRPESKSQETYKERNQSKKVKM